MALQLLKLYFHMPQFLSDHLHAIMHERKIVVKDITCIVIAMDMVAFPVSITALTSSYFKQEYH
jgi:hypothetical protein